MTKLSKNMQQAFDKMTLRHQEACNKSYEEWSVDSEWCGYADRHDFRTYEQEFERNVERFGRESTERSDERCRKAHEDARNGIVKGHWNTGTLRALESRGYIEVMKVGGNSFDTVKLLTI